MSNVKISLIIAIIPPVIFLLIPTIDILLNPGKYDGNAIGFGYLAGSVVAVLGFLLLFALSMLALKFLRKNK